MTTTKIDVLGRTYAISEKEAENDELLRDNNLDGYTDQEAAEIVIRKKDNEYGKNCVLRHEIIHAFLFESGLGFDWERPTLRGHDETTVDWFATQWPKIHKVFVELGCDK